MKSILLIEPIIEFREIFNKNISKYFAYQVKESLDVQNAIKILITSSQYEMIMVRDTFTGVNNVGVLISFLKKNNLDIPLVILGNDSFSYENEILINPNYSWRKILKEVSYTLNVILSDKGELQLTDFVSLPVFYFFQLNSSHKKCEIFIQKFNNNDFEYEKVFGAKDPFDRSDLESFSGAGIDKFYVLEEFGDDFIAYASDTIFNKFIDKKLSTSELLQLCSDAYDVARDRISRFGMDSKSILILARIYDSIKKIIEKDNVLHDFLNRKLDLILSYGFVRIFFVALLAPKIFPQLGFVTANSLEKFLYLNLLHDISINDDALLKINSEVDLLKVELTKEQLNIVMNHAAQSAELISSINAIPYVIGELVLEHHGSKSGIGFKNNLSISLSVLSMVLLVTEDIVTELLVDFESLTQKEIDNVFQIKANVFNKLNYKETLEALKSVIVLS